ncbi:MAG: SusC/RagA family TonB-linked outer membrane protein [Bacteroidales bacterium]
MRKYFLIAIFLLTGFQLTAQITVTGVVTSAGDELPLPGATIVEEGTTNGIMADMDGKFTLKIGSEESILKFVYIGFEDQFVKVGETRHFTIALEETAQLLNEVVVMGYGSVQSRETVVGSVEQVEMNNLSKISIAPSLDLMLEGQVAGVTIETSSGDPTNPVKVRIRGENSLPEIGSASFVASGEPLYILDGVPLVDISDPNVTTGVGRAAETAVNPLTFINPEDIESITVLKDASATAIYGANAANGVVLITTKKGTKGQTRVSFSQSFMMDQPINLMQYLNTDQYLELLTEYYVSKGTPADQLGNVITNQDVNTNWRDLTLKNAISHKSHLSISGGGGSTSYRMSFGLNDTETTTLGNDFRTITSRFNITSELNDYIQLTYNGGISNFDKNAYAGFATYNFRPNIPIRDENGRYTIMDGIAHPLAEVEQNINKSGRFYTNNSLALKVIMKDLVWRTNFGIDYTNSKNFLYRSAENRSGMKDNGFIKEQRRDNFNWIGYTQLDYSKRIKGHTLSTTWGVQAKEDNTTRINVTDKDLISTIIILPGVGSENNQDVAAYVNRDAMLSAYGRLGYEYGSRYFASFNFRSDASSYFGGDHAVENFLSGGLSWNISNEDFWKKNDVINFLKVKTSFGKTGNARIGSYAARGLYNYSISSSYNGIMVVSPHTAPNPDLGWQTSYKFNAGVTAHFFKKMNLDIEFYKNWNENSIMSMDVIPETGWNNIPVNAASMTNTGLETTLRFSGLKLREVNWNTNFNISFNTNKLTKLANNQNIIYTNSGLILGESTSLIMGFEYAGVDPATGNPRWYMADGTVTDNYSQARALDNRTIIGKSNPDFSGGFTNSFQYKGFNLNVLLTYEYGANFYLPYASRLSENLSQLYIFNMSVNSLDRWQQPGDITDIPKISNDMSFDYYSSRWLFDRSNISLKAVSFSYDIPQSVTERLRMKSLSLGMHVTNVFTWYAEGNKKGRNGIAQYRYPFPQSRTLAFELKVNL